MFAGMADRTGFTPNHGKTALKFRLFTIQKSRFRAKFRYFRYRYLFLVGTRDRYRFQGPSTLPDFRRIEFWVRCRMGGRAGYYEKAEGGSYGGHPTL